MQAIKEKEDRATGNAIKTHRGMEYGGLVSVIIPVYNVRPYLPEALDSVLYQTYDNLEIIVVDDGSTDGSGEICDEYAEKDGRFLVVHQRNMGLSTARNAGLDRMTGEAVAFLDSDDAYHPSFIGEMLSAMVREEADMVVSRFTSRYTTGPLGKSGRSRMIPAIGQGAYDRVSALRALVDRTISANVWNKLYRRELWEGMRFPDGHVYEDIETTFRVVDICGKIAAVDQVLYFHRICRGSITSAPSWRSVCDRYIAWSHFDAFIEKHTPEIFTPDQLKRNRQSHIKSMIGLYIRYTRRAGKRSESSAGELRTKVIETGREIGIDTLSLKTRIAYHMLCLCPWLIKAIYPVYRYIRYSILTIF